MVPIWHHFANSFYFIFIILRRNYTFWWKDHVKKATIKAKSKASMLYNLQPFLKISDFSKSMVLINFKMDFERLFGLKKQLLFDRKLIVMWTDWQQTDIASILRKYDQCLYQKFVGVYILWNYKWEPLIWTKMCVSTFSVQERVLICSMLSLFWPSRLSCWIFLIIEGGIWISKTKIFEFEVKNLQISWFCFLALL